MFHRILIANRGEIACRVIATCRRLGIGTAAVYSDADAGAAHVAMADQAVRIGLAPPSESYLRGDAIIDAAQATGAQAIHPGYGFLSENAAFAEAVAAAGLVFIGPPARAIRAMGLKDAAKRAMEDAGVPVVPGYHGADQHDGLLADEAARIGFPVLIKARAGGGGRGMRRVDRAGDFAEALISARREAEGAFGDGAVLIEKYVTRPRHVEIQVFADAYGNAVHLFERDCSLQRRHQKVIEEAPAPGMTDAVRAAMGRAAVEAARAIGYVGAGTVEFIADGSRGLREDGFWFMEMNTRLQVEHPVTEAVTGHDLVEWQLRIAAGAPLPVNQADLALNGHAVEARLYAEDPARGFLPATGRLARLAFPDAARFGPGTMRVDSGVREGDVVSPHYDPMIAKLVAHGPDRATALARLRAGLAETRIAGVTTNRDFLLRLLGEPAFVAGDVETGLIDAAGARLVDDPAAAPAMLAVAALAALDLPPSVAAPDPWAGLTGWRAWGVAVSAVRLEVGAAACDVQVTCVAPGSFSVDAGGGALMLSVRRGGDIWHVDHGGWQQRMDVARDRDRLVVFAGAARLQVRIVDPLAAVSAQASGDRVTAPMPGLVRRVFVSAGQSIDAGAPLAVLEAMKMEHMLRAPRAGVVAEIGAAEGAQVADGTILVLLEPEND